MGKLEEELSAEQWVAAGIETRHMTVGRAEYNLLGVRYIVLETGSIHDGWNEYLGSYIFLAEVLYRDISHCLSVCCCPAAASETAQEILA